MTLDSSIVELGLDSLERMEIAAASGRTIRRTLSRRRPAPDRNAARSGRRGRSLPGQGLGPAGPPTADRRNAQSLLPVRSVPRVFETEASPRRCTSLRPAQSLLQGARGSDLRHHEDRRSRTGQLRQLQLPGHVGRPEGHRRRKKGHRSVRHQRLGQPPGLGRKDGPRRIGAGAGPLRRRRRLRSRLSAATRPTKRPWGTCSAPAI